VSYNDFAMVGTAIYLWVSGLTFAVALRRFRQRPWSAVVAAVFWPVTWLKLRPGHDADVFYRHHQRTQRVREGRDPDEQH